LQCLGIQSISQEACSKLVGIANDGAAANVAGNGLVERELDWIFWMWCLAHRHELVIKDALHGTSFDLLDEMLLFLTGTKVINYCVRVGESLGTRLVNGKKVCA